MKIDSGIANVTLEYEKLNESLPAPTKYLQFALSVLEDIDAHVVKG